jgi:hypothetical protein
MCRLIIFLRSSDTLLKYLEVPIEADDVSGNCDLEKMPVSPMKAMEAVRDDPLYYVRYYIRENWQCGIYRVGLPRKFDWAACYLEDKEVPGTKAHQEDQKLLAQWFEALEEETLVQSPVRKKGGKK